MALKPEADLVDPEAFDAPEADDQRIEIGAADIADRFERIHMAVEKFPQRVAHRVALRRQAHDDGAAVGFGPPV